VRKSIPYYDDGQELICSLSDFFVRADSICYDLGTATGGLVSRLARHHAHKPDVLWVGIDNQADMLQQATGKCSDLVNVQLVENDILLHEYEKSDFITAYYTMQFVPERHRQEIYNRLYETLNWGGALVVFEKVRAPDARFQDIMTTLYNDYKQSRGFSSEEIINKGNALKGVMSPFSSNANLELFSRAGFQDVMSIYKYICFEGFLAIK
jgi:tRNA (cmo5U34)-methyltransferase